MKVRGQNPIEFLDRYNRPLTGHGEGKMGTLQTKGLPELEIGADRWVSKPARYPFVITSAEEKPSSKTGAAMISIRCVVEAPGTPDDGVSFFDNLVIEGASAAYFKKRLRQLGVPVEQDGVTGEQICAHLLGKRFFADLTLEPAMTKSESGAYDKPKKYIDANGNEAQAYQSRPTAYYQHAVGGVTTAAPVQQQAPVQAAPVQQTAPSGFGGPPPGFGGAPQGFAQPGAGAVAPQGFAQPPAGFAQPQANGGAPQGFGGAPAGVPAPWATPPAQQPAQAEAGSTGGKRGKKA